MKGLSGTVALLWGGIVWFSPNYSHIDDCHMNDGGKILFRILSKDISFISSKDNLSILSKYILLFFVHIIKKIFYFINRNVVVYTSQWYISLSFIASNGLQTQANVEKCLLFSGSWNSFSIPIPVCGLRSPNSHLAALDKYSWLLWTNTVDQIWQILHVSPALEIHTMSRGF